MKLLFDQNISFRVANKLKEFSPGCKHISECGLMGCDDSEIWNYAQKNGYAIVTFDADFYDISVINGHPPKIIWIRTGNLKTPEILELLIKHRETVSEFLTGEEFSESACLEIY